MDVWYWIVGGIVAWLIMSAAVAVVWVAIVHGLRRRRRNDRRRRGLS